MLRSWSITGADGLVALRGLIKNGLDRDFLILEMCPRRRTQSKFLILHFTLIFSDLSTTAIRIKFFSMPLYNIFLYHCQTGWEICFLIMKFIEKSHTEYIKKMFITQHWKCKSTEKVYRMQKLLNRYMQNNEKAYKKCTFSKPIFFSFSTWKRYHTKFRILSQEKKLSHKKKQPIKPQKTPPASWPVISRWRRSRMTGRAASW